MRRLIPFLALLGLLSGCTRNFSAVDDPPHHTAILTGGPWASMIYAAQVDDGVILVDLGWDDEGDALREALERLEAEPEDVVAVFLTHGHRDHTAGWRFLPEARFYLGAEEIPGFLGERSYHGFVPRLAAALVEPERPGPGELELHGLFEDTAIVVGSDTVHAFLLAGHTPGSMAYLFRGVLFLGDAVTWTPLYGFHSARREYSDDVERSQRNLAALWRRLEGREVKWACTAHGKCAPMDSAFRREALR